MNLSSVSSKMWRLFVELSPGIHCQMHSNMRHQAYFPKDVFKNTSLSQTLAANAKGYDASTAVCSIYSGTRTFSAIDGKVYARLGARVVEMPTPQNDIFAAREFVDQIRIS